MKLSGAPDFRLRRPLRFSASSSCACDCGLQMGVDLFLIMDSLAGSH
jgi:hypothetical protein